MAWNGSHLSKCQMISRARIPRKLVPWCLHPPERFLRSRHLLIDTKNCHRNLNPARNCSRHFPLLATLWCSRVRISCSSARFDPIIFKQQQSWLDKSRALELELAYAHWIFTKDMRFQYTFPRTTFTKNAPSLIHRTRTASSEWREVDLLFTIHTRCRPYLATHKPIAQASLFQSSGQVNSKLPIWCTNTARQPNVNAMQ